MVHVLIVEDRPVACQLLEAELAKAARVHVAGVARNGFEALDLVRSIDPDVVLMDVVMPEMDGIEALARLREFSDVPVIMLTGANIASDSLEHIARRQGADGFFRKPSGSISVNLYSISEALVVDILRLADRRRRRMVSGGARRSALPTTGAGSETRGRVGGHTDPAKERPVRPSIPFVHPGVGWQAPPGAFEGNARTCSSCSWTDCVGDLCKATPG